MSDGSLSLALGTFAPARAIGDPSFAAIVTTTESTGSGATLSGAQLADFNQDGHLDLVYSKYNGGGSVVVELGNGDGTFKQGVSYRANWAQPMNITVGDVNNDGILDFITSHFSATEVYIGNGDGTFRGSISFTTTSTTNFQRALLVDLNGDGNLDWVNPPNSTGISVNLGNGNGTFQPTIAVATGSTGSYSVTSGDFNNDGRTDLAVGHTSGSSVRVLFGNGNGTFQLGQLLSSGNDSDVRAADLNNDGELDLISGGGSGLRVYLGMGNGTFRSAVSFAGVSAGRMEFFDFNSDGYLDVIGSQTGGASFAVSLGNGDGSLRAPLSFAQSFGGAAFATGDLNGDGRLDTVGVLESGGTNATVSIRLGNGALAGGLASFSLRRREEAYAAMNAFRAARTKLLQEQGMIGSFQSRLSSSLSNMQQTSESYLQASSRITDVDVAEESAQLFRSQAIQQAAQAILAQANQTPQLALNLLRFD